MITNIDYLTGSVRPAWYYTDKTALATKYSESFHSCINLCRKNDKCKTARFHGDGDHGLGNNGCVTQIPNVLSLSMWAVVFNTFKKGNFSM